MVTDREYISTSFFYFKRMKSIEELKELYEKLNKKGVKEIQLFYNKEDKRVEIFGYKSRLESDFEYQMRMEEEERDRQKKINIELDKEEKEKALYIKLKKKYDGLYDVM